ncbi:hypothetical protein [Sediminibacterium sp.]|uniref:hypothetical protein n=1 Tax=Sediminibacterium sp. TaxID=1917865 RepID=UPI0008BE553C|nr:hypothetical protein [Sediminibacterium sp.]MDP3393075.1 hypothetical protein [Sediminibacterium sp.]MDP3567678.1 hypothetical protein [Sediminibacterium sp.]OHC84720.1 MAG: hypothetical protein A2472_10325 [Sphingobacteriia bacterium RIFOXYC2_FULL_35_18]OHC88859.1 MAG: hypothetical protein A2546_06570 [Sphingobacteriia bacterium RIFOXYD2_FULL_35_12]
MYEITKNKSITTKIAYGIIGLILLSALLKILFKEPELTLDQELQEISNMTNKHTPIQIDSLTTLNNTQALYGNKLQYNISINADKANVDTTILVTTSKERVINMLKTDPKGSYFFTNKIDIIYRYTDKTGKYICQIIITPKDLSSQ